MVDKFECPNIRWNERAHYQTTGWCRVCGAFIIINDDGRRSIEFPEASRNHCEEEAAHHELYAPSTASLIIGDD